MQITPWITHLIKKLNVTKLANIYFPVQNLLSVHEPEKSIPCLTSHTMYITKYFFIRKFVKIEGRSVTLPVAFVSFTK